MGKLSHAVRVAMLETYYEDKPDVSDEDIISEFSPSEIFDTFLHYEGIFGYGSKIKDAISSIYDVTLDK